MTKVATRTYAESQGKKPFDWNAFLSTEKHTEEEWKNAMDLSSNWVTCACGNQCDILERDEVGFPKDFRLQILGTLFYYTLVNRDIHQASSILREIEERAAILIDRIQCQNSIAP